VASAAMTPNDARRTRVKNMTLPAFVIIEV
jgi:hypothetical protein